MVSAFDGWEWFARCVAHRKESTLVLTSCQEVFFVFRRFFATISNCRSGFGNLKRSSDCGLGNLSVFSRPSGVSSSQCWSSCFADQFRFSGDDGQ